MAKLTVPINSAGGGIGEIKNKVYERKKVYDSDCGIKKTATYYLKHGGINYYEPKTTATSSTPSPGPGIGVAVSIPTICAGENCLVLYKTAQTSLNEHGIDSNTISYYNALNTSQADFAAVYNISNDTWYKFNQDTSSFDIPFEEDDEDYSLLEISNLEFIGNGEALASMIVNEDGSTFNPRYYKIVNVTVEEYNQNLKNWYYDGYLANDSLSQMFLPNKKFVLLNVPKWDIIKEYAIDDIEFSPAFYDDGNITITAGFSMPQLVVAGGSLEPIFIVKVQTNDKNYYITDRENSWIEVNVSEHSENEIINAPDIVLDELSFLDNTLKNAVYGPQIYLLKNKFAEIDNIINKEVNNIVLKDKIYDYVVEGSSNLENGKEYSFKEDCSDFFNKGYTPQDIYDTNSNSGGVELLSTKGGEMIYEPEEETISFITYDFESNLSPKSGVKAPILKGSGYIHIVTNVADYYFYADGNSWSNGNGMIRGIEKEAVLPPNLKYNSQYVRNEEMLKDILNLGQTKAQTLGEKFAEGIKDWNYEVLGVKHRLALDMSVIKSLDYLAMAEDCGLLPEMNSASRETVLYEDTEKQFALQLYVYKNNGNYFPRLIYNGSEYYWYDAFTNVWEKDFNNTQTIITSQDELPEIDYNINYVKANINPKLVTSLIVDIKQKRTLEQKIKDLSNWEYSEEYTFRNVPDWTAFYSMDFDSENMYQNPIYGDVDTNKAITVARITDENTNTDGFAVMYWYDTSDLSNAIYYVIFSRDNPSENIVANTWYKAINSNNSIQMVEEMPPALSYNSNFVLNQNGFDAIIVQQRKTLRQKFQTCLTLERLTNITIPSTSINTENTNDYANSGFIWKVTLQDDAFKDALKVDVLFDLSQIISENVCPIQDVDAENGTLTLYVKQNSGNILVNRIDIFKNCK